MKGEKMLLWILIFIGAFILAVSAVVIYQKSEDTANVSLQNLINVKVSELKKSIEEVASAQKTLSESCLATVDEKQAALLKKIDAITKENEILKVRLNSVDKRFRELPKTVDVRIKEPIEVDVIRRPKANPGQGKKSLLERSGVFEKSAP
jgi:predicted flavoprotein YhiN